MLRLIEQALPASLHRFALKIAYRVRHHWRRFRKRPLIGCVVIISDLKGQLLLLRHSYGPQGWALPGGGVKRGEDPMLAASRELHEELGLAGHTPWRVGEIKDFISGSPHTTHVFALKIDREPRPDNREVIEARFFPSHSLPEPMGEPTRQQLALWRSKNGIAASESAG